MPFVKTLLTVVAVQVVEATTANGMCTMRIKAVPLPGPIATAIDKNAELIRMTLASSGQNPSAEDQSPATPGASEGNGAASEASHRLTTASEDATSATQAMFEASDTLTASTQQADASSGTSSGAADASREAAVVASVHDSGAATTTDAAAAEEPAQGSTTAAAAEPLDAQSRQENSAGSFDQTDLASSSLLHPPDQDHDNHISHEATNTDTAADAASDVAVSNGNAPTQQVSASTSSQDMFRANNHERTIDGNAIEEGERQGDDDEEEEGADGDTLQHASGKVGVLRQRLMVAAKEAGNGTDKMLEVSQVTMCMRHGKEENMVICMQCMMYDETKCS